MGLFTNNKKTDSIVANEKQKLLNTLSSVVLSRARWMSALGEQQYGGDRDIYEALGYKTIISYEDYEARYFRQDIAKAIIDRPARLTWKGDLFIVENLENETALEKAWIELNNSLKLESVFFRTDKVSRIGKYGIILLGLDDVKNRQSYQEPVKPGDRKLMYAKPISECNAQIDTWVRNSSDKRFGLPLYYQVKITEPNSNVTTDIRVHYTRVVHIVDDILESEIEGSPALMPVFNRLMDMEKLVGASAEMFWRGARPGYQGKLNEDYTMTAEVKEDLQNQIDEFEHNLRRILVNEGIDLKSLEQQIADPQSHVDVIIQMISAVTGIPKRILTGTERGDLASTQDRHEWLAYIQTRREEFAEAKIIRPFVDTCIQYGILPKPQNDKYDIKWDDLFAPSEKEMADVGRIRAEALRAYASQPGAEIIIPPDVFSEIMLGLTPEQMEMIQKIQKENISQENEDFENE